MDDIVGVKLSKVDKSVLVKWCGQMLDKTPTTVSDQVEQLTHLFINKAKSKLIEIGRCENCGGVSDLQLTICPYCGDNQEEEHAAPTKALALVPTPDKKPGKDKSPAKPEGRRTRSQAAAATKSSVSSVGSTALAVESEVQTEADLDRAVALIKEKMVDSVTSLYETGLELKKIHSQEMWKLRTGSKITNFKAFCSKELGLSDTYAYKMINVCEIFTQTDVEKFGVNKLGVVLTVPPELRGKLKAQLESGASQSKLSEAAKRLKEGKPEKNAKPNLKDAVTMLMPKPRLECLAYAASTEPAAVGKKTKPATSLTQSPWTMIKMANDVTLFIRMTKNASGALMFIVEARPGKETGVDDE